MAWRTIAMRQPGNAVGIAILGAQFGNHPDTSVADALAASGLVSELVAAPLF